MSASNAPPLYGLVVAGGASRRMGRDKGTIPYHGQPQVTYAWRLLSEICGRAYVSTNARKAGAAPYVDLPLVLDDEDYFGPAAGLQAAWHRHPDAAWLVLAVDMPLVDRPLLTLLLGHRNLSAPATAFRHADGTLEPLCAIWEPSAREPLLQQLRNGERSLRRFLERSGAEPLRPPHREKLRSVNDFDEYSSAARMLGMKAADPGDPTNRGF